MTAYNKTLPAIVFITVATFGCGTLGFNASAPQQPAKSQVPSEKPAPAVSTDQTAVVGTGTGTGAGTNSNSATGAGTDTAAVGGSTIIVATNPDGTTTTSPATSTDPVTGVVTTGSGASTAIGSGTSTTPTTSTSTPVVVATSTPTPMPPATSFSITGCQSKQWTDSTVCPANFVMFGYAKTTVSCCQIVDNLGRAVVWTGAEISRPTKAPSAHSNSACEADEFMTSIYTHVLRVDSVGCRKFESAAKQPVRWVDSVGTTLTYRNGDTIGCSGNSLFSALWDSNSDQDVDSFRCLSAKF